MKSTLLAYCFQHIRFYTGKPCQSDIAPQSDGSTEFHDMKKRHDPRKMLKFDILLK